MGGDEDELFYIILEISVLFLAVIIDIWKHKIPNILVMILLIINLLSIETSIVDSSITFEGMLLRTGQLALILIFLFPFFSVGALGAGDIKIIIVTALGLDRPFYYFVIIWISAAVLAVGKLVIRKEAKARTKHLYVYIKTIFLTGKITPYLDESVKKEAKVSYSVHLSVPVLMAKIIYIVTTIVK